MTPTETALARICQDLLRLYRETGTELMALRIALTEKGVGITPEELAAATQRVHEVLDLEQAMRPAAATDLVELVEQLRRWLEDLLQKP